MDHAAEYTKEELIERVKRELPGFYKACQETKGDVIILTQEAFAYKLTVRELELLGIAIKCAGFFNKEVTIICNPK